MASYTMELREYIEMWSQDNEALSAKERIEIGRPKLFDFNYPIFDPNYKNVFETNFIRKFYMREIGFETENLFKFQLETWLLINMPYFNKMFESELLKFDPLMNTQMSTDSTKNKDTDSTLNTTTDKNTTKTTLQKIDGTENKDVLDTEIKSVDGTSSDTSFNRVLESNTPDNRLAITTADGAGVIEYASNIQEGTLKNNGTSSNDVNGTTTSDVDVITTKNIDGTDTDVTGVTGLHVNAITDLETFIQTSVGKIGSVTYSKMLMEYRESLVRIENKMFEEMQQLFMLVY